MKERKEKHEGKARLLYIAKTLEVHCTKVNTLVNGFEKAQISNTAFSLSQPFYTTTSKSMTKVLKNLLGTYEALRLEVREVAQIGYVSFETSFPELDINFETYYSVATSLLNLTFQMQLLRLYCYRILKR